MSRLCNELRQRLTPAHLDQLMVIVLEGNEHMTQDQDLVIEVVCHWYMQQPRRIQLPDPAKRPVTHTNLPNNAYIVGSLKA